jgi:hypothetical protein
MASTESRFTPERASKIVGFLFICGVGVPAAITAFISTVILAWQGVLIMLGKSTIPSFRGTFFVQWLPIIFLGLIGLSIPVLAIVFITQAAQSRNRRDHNDKSSGDVTRDDRSSYGVTVDDRTSYGVTVDDRTSYGITMDASYRELPPGRHY